MSHIIDQSSVPSSKTEIDLFTVPSTQVAVEHGSWHHCHPSNTITEMGPYEFHIPPDPHFLDLNNNYILMHLRIVRPQNQILRDNNQDVVGPINLLGKTFFKQVKLFLNSKLVYDSGDTYAYRAFLETELNYGYQPKQTRLRAAGYKSDSPFDQVNTDQNLGWGTRVTWFQESAIVELMAPLHVDLFHQEKYLLNKIDLRLELHRNENSFALMSFAQPAQAYKIMVENMRWIVRKVNLMSSVSLAIESTLMKTAAKYPVRRVQMKAIQLDAGRRDTPTNTLFEGQIPRRIILGIVAGNAFHGTYTSSPFNFQNFSATSIQITAGGENFPANPLSMDFENQRFMQAYVQLFESLGIAGMDKSCWITPEQFGSSSCLYAFDLTPDSADGNHWELIKEGSTTLQMTFRDAIPAGGAKLIVLAEFDNLLTIDRFRNVFYDYTP